MNSGRAMRDVMQGGLTLIAALLVYAVFGRWLAALSLGLNVFLLAVVLFAMVKGDLAGALIGTAAGLAADAFSVGVFGLNGVVFTAVGFFSGWVSRRISVAAFGRSFVFIGVMAVAGLFLRLGLTAAMLSERIPWSSGRILLQPPIMALAGALVFSGYRRVRGSHVQ